MGNQKYYSTANRRHSAGAFVLVARWLPSKTGHRGCNHSAFPQFDGVRYMNSSHSEKIVSKSAVKNN
jgi:hypothetical protein